MFSKALAHLPCFPEDRQHQSTGAKKNASKHLTGYLHFHTFTFRKLLLCSNCCFFSKISIPYQRSLLDKTVAVTESLPHWSHACLTQECDDAAQNSQEGTSAETSRRVGHGSTWQGHAIRVALAHTHRQRVCAAQRGTATVHYQHWQPIHRLLPPPEAPTLRQNGRRVVWKKKTNCSRALTSI